MTASTVPVEIRQEAARTLLERLREKTALVRWFRYNASAKHGLPIEADREITFSATVEEPTAEAKPEPVADPKLPEPIASQPIKAFVYNAPASSNGTVKGILATLAIVGGIVTTGVVGWALGSRTTVPGKVEAQQFMQSPYQFLEDMGAHWDE